MMRGACFLQVMNVDKWICSRFLGFTRDDVENGGKVEKKERQERHTCAWGQSSSADVAVAHTCGLRRGCTMSEYATWSSASWSLSNRAPVKACSRLAPSKASCTLTWFSCRLEAAVSSLPYVWNGSSLSVEALPISSICSNLKEEHGYSLTISTCITL